VPEGAARYIVGMKGRSDRTQGLRHSREGVPRKPSEIGSPKREIESKDRRIAAVPFHRDAKASGRTEEKPARFVGNVTGPGATQFEIEVCDGSLWIWLKEQRARGVKVSKHVSKKRKAIEFRAGPWWNRYEYQIIADVWPLLHKSRAFFEGDQSKQPGYTGDDMVAATAHLQAVAANFGLPVDVARRALEQAARNVWQPHPYGICVSNVRFSEGIARATIRFPKVGNTNSVTSEGRLLFGYRSPAARYLTVGLGGHGYACTVYYFEPTNGWRCIA
jgi:hypothetical protein